MLSYEIRLESADWDRMSARLVQELPDALKRSIAWLGILAAGIMKENAPRKTGDLGRSVEMTLTDDGFGAEVGPTMEYSPHVVLGTRPSPGRYVPQIGKRLINPRRGMHPGNPPNPFIDETALEVEKEAPQIIEMQIQPLIMAA